MFFFIYHSEPCSGNLYLKTPQAAIREIFKSHFVYDASINYNNFFSKETFISLDIHAFYNEKLELMELHIPNYGLFLYKEFSLYSEYRTLVNFLRKNQIIYQFNKNEKSLSLENGNIIIIYDDFDDFANAKVKYIKLNFLNNNCSISLERLSINTFPPKSIFKKADVSEGQVPQISVFFEHQIHFATFGKSKATRNYLNSQIDLINSGKYIDCVKKDIAEIKSKTISIYSSDLNNMQNFAKTLPTNMFMTLTPESNNTKES